MSVLTEYICEQAEKKKKTPQEWLQATVGNFSKCTLATHVGKFTNPDSKVVMYDGTKEEQTGLVMTSSVDHKTDIIYSSAAFMAAAKLLLKPLEDNEPLLLHLLTGDAAVYGDMEKFGMAADDVRNALESIHKANSLITDGNLRQVYFPVGSGVYHLLTVLPESSLLETMRDRIREKNNRWYDTSNPKTEVYRQDAAHLTDLTVIGFGGTKPQNISTLNADAGGKAFLLPSLPPMMDHLTVHLPRHSFFRECIPYTSCKNQLQHLQELFQEDRNNLAVRRKIHFSLENLVDFCIEIAAGIQMQQAGWSQDEKFSNLSREQKIWLDDIYRDERERGEWSKEIGKQFGRWLVIRYNRIAGKEKVPLGNAELQMFSDVMEESLVKEVNLES